MRRLTMVPLLLAAGAAFVLVAGCGDDGGDSAAECTPATEDLTVGAEDSLEFDADAYEVDAGCLDVTYRNDGNVAHTLVIDGVDDFKLEIGDVDEGSVDLAPGTYRMYCDLPAHEAAGMEAELTVD